MEVLRLGVVGRLGGRDRQPAGEEAGDDDEGEWMLTEEAQGQGCRRGGRGRNSTGRGYCPGAPDPFRVVAVASNAPGGYGLRRSTRVSPHGPADGRSIAATVTPPVGPDAP